MTMIQYNDFGSTAVLYDQSTEYHGTFLDQVPSTGTAVLLKSTVPTSGLVASEPLPVCANEQTNQQCMATCMWMGY